MRAVGTTPTSAPRVTVGRLVAHLATLRADVARRSRGMLQAGENPDLEAARREGRRHHLRAGDPRDRRTRSRRGADRSTGQRFCAGARRTSCSTRRRSRSAAARARSCAASSRAGWGSDERDCGGSSRHRHPPVHRAGHDRAASRRPRRAHWPAALWHAVDENGLTLPRIPEAAGGAGGELARGVRRGARRRAHRGAAAGRRDHASPAGSWRRPGSTCRSGPLGVRAGPARRPPEPRARRRPGAHRHRGARAVGPARGPRGRRRRRPADADDRRLSRTGATRSSRRLNLAREPRDTLSSTGAPVVAARGPTRGCRRARHALRRPGARGADGRRPRAPPAQSVAVRERARAVRRGPSGSSR